MKHFVLPESFKGQKDLKLTGKDFHYLCRVRRMKAGQEMTGIDRMGKIYSMLMVSQEKDSCTLHLSETRRMSRSGPEITLYQCLLKGKKFDQLIRDVTEAGVARIVPVESDFSVSRIDVEDGVNRKVDRWNRIIREAVQQSGSGYIPEILPPVHISEVPSMLKKNELGFFFHQDSLEKSSLHGYLASDAESVSYLIGPEGGLSPEEVRQLSDGGYHPVFLGKNILRAETASLYALAAIQVILLEKKSWVAV